jgi:hypothetical protein
MLERQREGIAKAKAAGKYKGRPASIDAAQIRQTAGRAGTRGDREASASLGVRSTARWGIGGGNAVKTPLEPHQCIRSGFDRPDHRAVCTMISVIMSTLIAAAVSLDPLLAEVCRLRWRQPGPFRTARTNGHPDGLATNDPFLDRIRLN